MRKYLIILMIHFTMIIIAQDITLKSINGPMGGIIGDIGINSKGEIFAGAYSVFIGYSGLYKSEDNGNSWVKIESQFDDFEVYSIYITNEDHIWVGTNFQGRIYRSTDNGKTWENKRNGYNTGECWAFGESKDGVLFAGDGQYYNLSRSLDYGENWELSANLRPFVFATDSNNIVYAGTHDGLFGTSDNGITWGQNNFLKNIPVSTIVIDENNNIYCGTGYYDNGNGVYYSTDGGVTWTQIGLEGKIVLSLAFDSEKNLLAGTAEDGLFKTTNNGENWTQYQKGLYKKQLFRLKLNKEDDIFIGSEEEGVFRSINGGEEFEQVGLPLSNSKDIKFYGDSLLFSSTPSGVQKYNIETKKWTNIGLHNVFGLDITENGTIYAATFADGLFKTEDFGKNWILTNLTKDSIMSVYNVVAKNEDTILAATEFNLRKSTDGGENWTILPVKTSFFSRGMSINNNQIWVTGTGSMDYIYKSTDYSNFELMFSYSYGWAENNCISALSNESVFVTDPYDGTYRSTDNGETWQQLLTGGRGVWTIYAEDNGLLLGGARDTIWYSDDLGDNFIGIKVPFDRDNNITDIKRGNNNQLYFSTYETGIFELDILTIINDTKNTFSNYELYQNYPNPFNPTTSIEYTVPSSEYVTLKVYDILGNEVATLVNEQKTAGRYEVEFNASNIASGVYFYRIQTSTGFVSTKKLLLIK